MSAFTAIIIISTSMMPVTIDTGHKSMSLMVSPTKTDELNPAFKLDVRAPEHTTVGRLTGVESNVYVNVPSSTSITFASEKLCEAAAAKLSKADGVRSVTCVQTAE
jgi:hypothetical protein